MDTFTEVVKLVYENCFFASIDLKHAYYSVPIAKIHRDWFRFIWHGKHYRFKCLVQGYRDAPRLFSKLLRPVFAHLHELGMISSSYIDDFIFLASSDSELRNYLDYASKLFDNLGFTINLNKSSFLPSHEMEYLGFILNSSSMTVTLTLQKQEKIKTLGSELLMDSKITVRKFASFIGNLVAASPAVTLAPLKYKPLEIVKNKVLMNNCGNYDTLMILDDKTKLYIKWWINNISLQKKTHFLVYT